MERMRGPDGLIESMFTVLKLDDFVPKDHPLRPIRTWLNDALKRMDDVFARMYEADAKGGRPSIAPEKLVRALLLQVLYSIRSERMLVDLPRRAGRTLSQLPDGLPASGGGIAPALADYVAKHYGIERVMYFALAALVIGFVVAISLKETAPRRRTRVVVATPPLVSASGE